MAEKQDNCLFIRKRKGQALRSRKNEETKIQKVDKRRDFNPLKQKSKSVLKNTVIEESNEPDIAPSAYTANRSEELSGPKDQGATATVEIHTETDKDARALFENAQKLIKEDENEEKKNYKGKNNYFKYLQKKETSIGNAYGGFNKDGPMRAPAHLRATIRWDYQPDICKDYKETGFCSFGDSCKFLHDRSDYKAGWQIDQEIEEGTYGCDDDDKFLIHNLSDNEEDRIPEECQICRKEFKDPVKSKCNHYFCSACAIKRLKRSKKCYICQTDTQGTFTSVNNIKKLIENQKRKRKEAKNSKKNYGFGKMDSDEESDNSDSHSHHQHEQDDTCCEHKNSPRTKDFGEEDSEESEEDEQEIPEDETLTGGRPEPNVPLITRLDGAKPELLEYCNTSEEESD